MAKYLYRSCPRCNGHVVIVIRDAGRNTPLQAVNGHCLRCSYRLAWIVIRGELIGKKQDKLGRWRRARVPSYSSDPVHAYAIDERLKQLGRSERYLKELS